LFGLGSFLFSFLIPLMGVVFCFNISPFLFFFPFHVPLLGVFPFIYLFLCCLRQDFIKSQKSVKIFCLGGSSGWTFFFEIFIHLGW
jgi:hypothetical protein